VRNQTKDTSLGRAISVADTGLTRLFGLLGKRRLDAGTGLLILPSSGVHTFGMLFAIDIVALDREMRVRGVWERVGAFRLAGLGWKTHGILELPVGSIQESHTEVNDQLMLGSAY
ncbi:MAG: DUF192 domain-containing protein, partial [Candidatus Korobacteraceae bacterium]